jgi:heme/copper-type cytochrome/quinol oxidase subunit 2
MLRERGTQATAMLIMDSVSQTHVHFNNIPSLNDNDNNNLLTTIIFIIIIIINKPILSFLFVPFFTIRSTKKKLSYDKNKTHGDKSLKATFLESFVGH